MHSFVLPRAREWYSRLFNVQVWLSLPSPSFGQSTDSSAIPRSTLRSFHTQFDATRSKLFPRYSLSCPHVPLIPPMPPRPFTRLSPLSFRVCHNAFMAPEIRNIQRHVLPNGLVVITEPMSHVRSVSVGVWIRNGSRREIPQENGLAHFIEHMVFKGTERR